VLQFYYISSFSVLDASGKIGSGLLSGNVNQYGDFDECLSAKSDELQGKFCMADFQIHLHPSLQHYQNQLLGGEPYSNKFNEILHITPKNSNNLWGVCMPSTCTHHDLEIAIKRAINENFGKYIKHIELEVKENNCQMASELNLNKLGLGTKLTM
jgi:hypothetical protein